MSFKGTRQLVHRVMYELTYGAVPAAFVCHKCDVPACVNPDHLFAGSAQDNTQDALAKGRKFGNPQKASQTLRTKARARMLAHIAATRPGGITEL